MSSTSQIRTLFISQLDAFVAELMNHFSDERELVLFCEKYNMIKGVNNKMVIDSFIQYVLPLKEKIVTKDESFFLNGGGQEEIADDYSSRLRDILKNVWVSKMDEANREIVWKYFSVFIKITEKYVVQMIKEQGA
jgi:hypothetical protein